MEKNKFHILVVDDDDKIRSLIKQYLIEKGFLISTAENAEKAKKIIEKRLSVRQAESLVKIFKGKKSRKTQSKDPNLSQLELSISEKLGLNVLIKNKKNNSGSIIFDYKDLEQLNKIIEVIKSNY